MTMTFDGRYEFRGLNSDGGVCHLRIYQAPGRTPVIVATELPENPNTSITNTAEHLYPDIVAKHFSDRFDYDEVAVFVEHYPPMQGKYGRGRTEDFDQVLFERKVPQPQSVGGTWRRTLGEPEWQPLGRQRLEQLIGQPFTAI